MFNHSPFLNIEVIKTFPREAVKFAKKYFKGKEIVACEIGVCYGRNSRIMNDNLNIKRLYLIDNYFSLGNKFNLEKIENYAHKRNNKGNEVWIKKLSEDAVKDIEMLDFLYIDGNHEYEYVTKDLELYFPKIKEGGIISGHDIQQEGVSKALLEFVNKNNLKVSFGDRRDWWILKGEKENE